MNSEAVILLSEIMSVPYCQEHADCQIETEADLPWMLDHLVRKR
jgi:hypothetical protein